MICIHECTRPIYCTYTCEIRRDQRLDGTIGTCISRHSDSLLIDTPKWTNQRHIDTIGQSRDSIGDVYGKNVIQIIPDDVEFTALLNNGHAMIRSTKTSQGIGYCIANLQ